MDQILIWFNTSNDCTYSTEKNCRQTKTKAVGADKTVRQEGGVVEKCIPGSDSSDWL